MREVWLKNVDLGFGLQGFQGLGFSVWAVGGCIYSVAFPGLGSFRQLEVYFRIKPDFKGPKEPNSINIYLQGTCRMNNHRSSQVLDSVRNCIDSFCREVKFTLGFR